MSDRRNKYDEEFKKNAVKLSYSSSKTIKETADDLGINVNMLHRWRKKYTPNGDKTQMASQEEEIQKLRSDFAELKVENDMLKKAAAFFARNQK